MTQTIRGLGVLATLLAATACLSAPDGSDAPDLAARVEPLGTTMTVTTYLGLVCGDSMSGTFGVDATIPSFVAPGEAFPVTIALRFAPAILTPYAGVLDATPTYEAAQATPASVSVPYDSVVFAARSVVEGIGTETINLTAAAQVGQPVTLHFPSIDYTTTWTAPRPPLVAHCTVPEDRSSLIATIPIVDEPQSKADCKHGGYASHTDDKGVVFRNQGACVKYVNNT